MRPTRAGVAVAAAAPSLAAIAWLFGQPELGMASVALLVLLAAAAASSARRSRVEVTRTVTPRRPTVGASSQVHLSVVNCGTSRTPVLRLRDDVGAFGEATMLLAPLAARAGREVTYRFPCTRRGVHPIGPLTIEEEDAFGLLRRSTRSGEVVFVVVRPSSHPLAPMPGASADAPEQGAQVLASSATVDEELASLRPYVVGDDVRRIHWRTSARTGIPVVREFDRPWQRHVTVLLDVRAAGDDAGFERAVSVAASVVRSSAHDGGIVRLVTSGGFDSGFVGAAEHADGLLDRLAAVHVDTAASVAAGVELLGPRHTGRLVTVVGRPEEAIRQAWDTRTHGYGFRVLVGTAASGEEVDPAVHLVVDPSTVVVRWDGSTGLSERWSDAMASARGPRPIPARM